MMNDKEHRYFEWLCDAVGVYDTDSEIGYILHEMFAEEFVWTVEMDGNRAHDGKSIRNDYMFRYGKSALDYPMRSSYARFLEVTIGLARKFSLQVDHDVAECFWHMMGNVGVNRDGTIRDGLDIWEIMDTINHRTYFPNGDGGFFPLDDPDGVDQRDVELLYQMYSYVLEFFGE